eukprot:1183795-Rhodomonas_salina.3
MAAQKRTTCCATAAAEPLLLPPLQQLLRPRLPPSYGRKRPPLPFSLSLSLSPSRSNAAPHLLAPAVRPARPARLGAADVSSQSEERGSAAPRLESDGRLPEDGIEREEVDGGDGDREDHGREPNLPQPHSQRTAQHSTAQQHPRELRAELTQLPTRSPRAPSAQRQDDTLHTVRHITHLEPRVGCAGRASRHLEEVHEGDVVALDLGLGRHDDVGRRADEGAVAAEARAERQRPRQRLDVEPHHVGNHLPTRRPSQRSAACSTRERTRRADRGRAGDGGAGHGPSA